jgi:hypothetical protein
MVTLVMLGNNKSNMGGYVRSKVKSMNQYSYHLIY